MFFHYLWVESIPEHQAVVERARTEQAAAAQAFFKAAGRAIAAPFAGLAAAIRRARRARRTYRALSALDDDRLNDIGVQRGEIATLARELAKRPAKGSGATVLPMPQATTRPRAVPTSPRPASANDDRAAA